MFLKAVISVALLAGVASALEVSEETKAIIEECRKPYSIEVEQIKNAVKNKKLPETENGKCFLECILEKGGLIKGDKIDVDRAKELSAKRLADKPDFKEKADKTSEICAQEATKPEGKCEFGLAIMKCAIKHREAMGIPPPDLDGI